MKIFLMMNLQKRFFSVLIHDHRFVMPAFARAILIQESAEGGLSYKGTKGRTPKSSARNKKYSHAYLQINTHNCISLISINLQTLLTRQAVLLKYLLPYCFLTNQLCYNLFRSIQIFHLYTLQL